MSASRKLTFEIFRFNPSDPDTAPHMQRFELQDAPYQTLYLALNRIREEQDPSLQFDFACRSAVCGSCGMMVNGRPVLACRTLTADLPDTIRLHPLPVFELVGDLSVDTGHWFRAMAEQVESWVHARTPFDPAAPEERMDDELARDDLRERALYRMRLLCRQLWCGAHARGLRRSGRAEPDRTLHAGSAGRA